MHTDRDGEADGTPGANVAAVVGSLLVEVEGLAMDRLADIESLVATATGARTVRIYIADYAYHVLSPLLGDADVVAIEGSILGRVFQSGEILVGEDTIAAPLVEGCERVGVAEYTFDNVSPDAIALVEAVGRVLVLALVSKRRYSDLVLRARRERPLTTAAEMQWDLLPPLACEGTGATIAGVLEPAYFIGGDSFDYAVNGDMLEFILIDAVGHGMPAVLKSIAAITTYRNVRRERGDLVRVYGEIGQVVIDQFGHSFYVTAVVGSLSMTTGELTWINAGHPPPLLVRDGTSLGELRCAPSRPMGLGGTVREQQRITLQPGDRVLFFTDGIVEWRGEPLASIERLGDLLVRATLDELPAPETLRRLARSVVEASGGDLRDDATMVLLEFRGRQHDETTNPEEAPDRNRR